MVAVSYQALYPNGLKNIRHSSLLYKLAILTIPTLFVISFIFYRTGQKPVEPVSPLSCYCESSTEFNCGASISHFYNTLHNLTREGDSRIAGADWEFEYVRDASNLALNQTQCNIAFPGQYEEIVRAWQFYQQNRIQISDLDAIHVSNGKVRAMIYHGEVGRLSLNFSHCALF